MKRKLAFVILMLIFSLVQSANSQVEEQISPSEKNPRAMDLIRKALVLEEAMMFERAIEVYKEVLKIEPKDFAAMNSIAGLYGKLANPAEEVMWAKKAMDTNPKFYQSYINYGNGFAMQGKFDDALRAYQDAEKLAPKSPLPVYSQGVVAENQRRFTEALGFYKKSIDLDPKFEDGLFSAAAMHANLRQFAEAKVLLSRLLVLNPKAEDAREMLRAIEREKP
jgi:tetratricopeptide (TPR) repeat protein